MQTPHRPRRDAASQEKELREAKQETRKLKVQLAQVRKQLVKALGGRDIVSENDPEPAMVESEETAEDQQSCPACGEKEIREVDAGPKVYLVCAACRWRKAKS